MKKNKGFTLVELLVVIAIIGLLASIAATAARYYRDKSKDSRIMTDFNQIRSISTMIHSSEELDYEDLCDTGSLNIGDDFEHGGNLSVLDQDIKRLNGGEDVNCYATTTTYCVQAQGAGAGLDHTGYIGGDTDKTECASDNISCE